MLWPQHWAMEEGRTWELYSEKWHRYFHIQNRKGDPWDGTVDKGQIQPSKMVSFCGGSVSKEQGREECLTSCSGFYIRVHAYIYTTFSVSHLSPCFSLSFSKRDEKRGKTIKIPASFIQKSLVYTPIVHVSSKNILFLKIKFLQNTVLLICVTKCSPTALD